MSSAARGGIAVVNVSSLLAQVFAQAMVDAVATQIVRDVAPDWSRLPCTPFLCNAPSDVPPGMPTLLIVDTSDQADALGYHTQLADGTITGIVAVKPCLDAGGTALEGPWSVAVVLSHEVIETMLDPACNALAETAQGYRWPQEACDAVEGGSYKIGPVSVSNYCLPAFFDPTPPAGARFDKLGILTAPFTLTNTGGYAEIEAPDGSTSQIGGVRPAHRPETHYSRTRKRRNRHIRRAAA